MVPDVTPTGIVVQKYGGSSVADAEKIKLVAQRIARTKAQGKKIVVVVSAMGKTTNQLIEKAKAISSSPSRRELDMLLTCGEREAMSLLTMALIEEGLEAISFTGSQAGILTNDRHSGARIVDAATLLEAISHDEMLELAASGAKVLHDASVEFARKSGIALWARATS